MCYTNLPGTIGECLWETIFAMERVITAFATHLAQIVDDLTKRAVIEHVGLYDAIPPDQLTQLATVAFKAFESDLIAGTQHNFPTYWTKISEIRAAQGFEITSLLRINEMGIEIMDAHMRAALAKDAEARAWWAHRLQVITYAGIVGMSQSFIVTHERIIREQAMQIQALSTPIMPVYEGILVLPLVGTIDARRAGQVMEVMLEGVVREQAEVVIVDITGVSVVDVQVANYLLQAARAIQLIGAQMVLVGISAEVAQTMVQLRVELSKIITRANLKAGIEYALRLQGQAIMPVQGESA